MPTTPFSLPASFSSQHPVLLFPVRVQVKFVQDGYSPYELRVRIYPDQLGLSTHEPELTPAEVAAGWSYWQRAPLVEAGQRHALEYWRPLVAQYGVPRARWILRKTTPNNLAELAQNFGSWTPNFPAVAQTESGWTRAAFSRAMPSQFTVVLYDQAQTLAELPASYVREQLFAGAQATYDPATILSPTSEFLRPVRVEHGLPIADEPLVVGFNPLSAEPDGVTGVDEDNRWTVDFAQALDKGLAIVVPLTATEFAKGFKRLVVLGVKDASLPDNQAVLQDILLDHAFADGLELVPQGTPTNNTDSGAAGYSSLEFYDAETSFALLQEETMFEPAAAGTRPSDGQRLTQALGIDPQSLGAVAHARGTDTSDALRLNQALWPATYGYFLEEMLRPLLPQDALLSKATRQRVREFFETYVLARGPVPAFRVGNEPYGVLPTTRFSAWQTPDAFGQGLAELLGQLDVTWTERLNPQPGLYPASLATGGTAPVAFPADPAGQPDWLTTLAADATSVEYYQRYLLGPVLTDSLHAFSQQPGQPLTEGIWTDSDRQPGRFGTPQAPLNPLYAEFRQLLDPTGRLDLPAAWPKLFEQTLQSTFTPVASAFADEPAERRGLGALIDEQPLSDQYGVSPFAGVLPAHAGLNYLGWLATASFDEIRLENFGPVLADSAAFTAPNSLLYRLLRQAVLLQYWEVARDYRQLPDQASAEPELFNITGPGDTARWALLYEPEQGQTLHEHLRASSPVLQQYLANVQAMAAFSTAHLERLLAEHLDLGSYRIDAWKIAQVSERLAALRQQEATKTGAYLGAFAWLEDLQPADRSRPISEDEPERFDPDNLGYMHAPSLSHGTAAAILRQGYKSRQLTADETDPAANRMAVNLSSRRVRRALALLEGLRLGHSLGVVLGQEFERGLQQAEATAQGRPYGSYVASFRLAFPGGQDQVLTSQAATAGLAPDQAARQVVDGLALLRATPGGYPYGVLGLPSDEAFSAFVAGQLASLTDTLDALSDLTVSEGVYQAAQGNMDRATAILESVAKGKFPVTPEIVHPPHRGNTVTHRVLVHLPADTTLGAWPDQDTPRAQAEPRLNAWLAQFFPAPETVALRYGYQQPGADEVVFSQELTLHETGLHPIDLLSLLEGNALQAGSPFDLLVRHAIEAQGDGIPVAGDAVLVVDYQGPGAQALRRLLPLTHRLRQLLAGARPALPNDLKAPSTLSAREAENPHATVDGSAVRGRLETSLVTLRALVLALSALPAPTDRPLTSAEIVALQQAVLFGVAEAPGALATRTAAAANLVRTALEARLSAAEARLAAPSENPGDAYGAAAQALFGPAFRVGIEFTLPPEASARYAAAATPAAAAGLLRYALEPGEAFSPLPMQEWLHSVACVRDPLDHLEKVLLIQDLVASEGAAPLGPLQPAQLATERLARPGEVVTPPYWLGQQWPADYVPDGDALSLVQWLPANYSATGTQVALWLDEWTETLPEPEETTALTFHFDQPNTEAAQTLLLVVSPRATQAGWSAEDLLGAVNETLDLAKKRTVEPDSLAFTHLGTLLPAVVAPVAQQAVTFTLDFGRLNDTARFQERPLSL